MSARTAIGASPPIGPDTTSSQPGKPPSRFRWVVLLIIFLVYMVAGADRANIGVVVPFLKQEFHLTNTDVGAMASLFYITYALIQVPTGLLYERFGVRTIFSLAMVATSFSTLFIGLASSVAYLKLGRATLGLAEGPINVGILSIINRWFPTAEKGTATGMFMASIKVSPAIVPPICAWIIYAYGWREVFYVFAVPGFILAAVWYFLVKDNPRDSSFCSPAELAHIESSGPANVSGVTRTVRAMPLLDRLILRRTVQPLDTKMAVLRSWNIWGCALGYFFIVGIAYAIMTWVPTYLVTVKNYPLFQMGFVASTPWIGAIIGNVAGGMISDRFLDGRRKPLMIVTAASTVFMMYALIYSPADPWLLAGLFTATGILLNLGYSTFLVYPMGLVTKDRMPFAGSIVNTGGALGGAFAPFVVGVVLDRFNWDAVFLFLAITSFATLLAVLTIVEPVRNPAQPTAVQPSA